MDANLRRVDFSDSSKSQLSHGFPSTSGGAGLSGELAAIAAREIQKCDDRGVVVAPVAGRTRSSIQLAIVQLSAVPDSGGDAANYRADVRRWQFPDGGLASGPQDIGQSTGSIPMRSFSMITPDGAAY